MNSPPRPGISVNVKASRPIITAQGDPAEVEVAVQGPEVALLHQLVDDRVLLLHPVVEQERAEDRGQRDGQEQGPEDREGIGVGHRPEQRPLGPGHGEERDEGADDDRGREEQRPLDLVRRLGDPVDQRPAPVRALRP